MNKKINNRNKEGIESSESILHEEPNAKYIIEEERVNGKFTAIIRSDGEIAETQYLDKAREVLRNIVKNKAINGRIVKAGKVIEILRKEEIKRIEEEEEIKKIAGEIKQKHLAADLSEMTDEDRGILLNLLRELREKTQIATATKMMSREKQAFQENEGRKLQRWKAIIEKAEKERKKAEERENKLKQGLNKWINKKTVKYPHLSEWIKEQVGIIEKKNALRSRGKGSIVIQEGTRKAEIIKILKEKGSPMKGAQIAREMKIERGALEHPLKQLVRAGRVIQLQDKRYKLV